MEVVLGHGSSGSTNRGPGRSPARLDSPNSPSTTDTKNPLPVQVRQNESRSFEVTICDLKLGT